jgi:hypothetical protein
MKDRAKVIHKFGKDRIEATGMSTKLEINWIKLFE